MSLPVQPSAITPAQAAVTAAQARQVPHHDASLDVATRHTQAVNDLQARWEKIVETSIIGPNGYVEVSPCD